MKYQYLGYIACTTILFVFGAAENDAEIRLSQITPIETIRKAGFPSETHLVTTEDGYILTLHRIPGAPGSTPVFMQHGLIESSAVFLINGKNGSLAFLLYRNGYDVWLGNSRGNTHSRRHVNLTTRDAAFWDFGWDELGLYDNSAAIIYIYNVTRKKLFYIGHSMGSTTFAVMAIERPDVAQNIKAMFAVAPAVYATYNKQPVFLLLSRYWKEILFLSKQLNIHEAFGRNAVFNFISDYVCHIFLTEVCKNLIFYFGGFNRLEFPENVESEFLSSIPAGTSVRVFVQYLQQMRVPKLRRFDYPSKERNLKLYNSTEPPEYNISKIQVPVAVFYSHNDWLVGARDAERFYEQVPNKLGIYAVEPYSHFDFLIGLNARQRVHYKILKIMSKYK